MQASLGDFQSDNGMVAGLLGKGCPMSKDEGCPMSEGVDLYLLTGKYLTYYPLGPFTWTFFNGIGREGQ